MIKLTDIAREMGVSVATVSNAFTGRGRMNEDTRKEILRTAEELGYVWSPRNKQADTRNYIVIIEGVELIYLSGMMEGLFEEAQKQGIQLPVFCLNIAIEDATKHTVDYLNHEIDRIVEQYAKPVGGVIYISQYARVIEGLFKKHCFPNVALFCTREKDKCAIHYNDHQGAYIAVEHLVQVGCKHIAMISGPIDSVGMFHRSSGFQRALIDNHIPYNPQIVYVGNWDQESGYLLAKKLLESDEVVDGIFAQNDKMAWGALKAIAEKNLNCPGDIAVVGFDNSLYSELATPAITSINPPFKEMGSKAVRSLIEMSEGMEATGSFLSCELIRKEST